MLIWRRLSSICGAKYLCDISSCFLPAVPFIIPSRSPDFAILCPRKSLCLEGLAPSVACPGCAGEAERHKGWYVSLQAAPRPQKGWLRYTQWSLAGSGTSGAVACACHRGGEALRLQDTAGLATTLTGRNNTVCGMGVQCRKYVVRKKAF